MVFLRHWGATAVLVPSILGAAGVGFFFVLSGFILTYAYGAEFAAGLDRQKLKNFWIARVARIYPVHILLLVFTALISGANIGHALYPLALSAQILLLQSWIPLGNVPYAFNGPSWSISDEAFFYLVFPVLAMVFLRWKSSLWSLGAAAFLVWLFVAVCEWRLPINPFIEWLVYVFPIPRLVDFALGVIAGAVFAKYRFRLTPGTATIVEVAALAAVLAAIAASPRVPPAFALAPYMALLWTAVVFIFALETGYVSAVLKSGTLVFLGEASYALYMVHHVVTDTFSGSALKLLLAPVIALSLAIVVHVLYEKPMRHWIRELATRRPSTVHL